MGSRRPLTVILGIAVILLLGLVLLARSGNVRAHTLAPLVYSFVAGIIAGVSPCGVLMLPTYLFFHAGNTGSSRIPRALLIAGVAVLGLSVVFMATGGLVGIGSRWLTASSPYTGLFLGAAMVGLGIWLLVTRRTLGIMGAHLAVSPQRSLVNAFLFGIAYALGSLSCSLPLFLGVAGSALTSRGMLKSIGQFLAYASGMGSIILGVAVGSVLFRQSMDRWLHLLSRHAYRLSAIFLIVIGVYSIVYRVAVILLAAAS